MAMDPYASCTCGSGKRFKWCCQPIYALVQKSHELMAAGQTEMAIKTIDQVVAQHPTSVPALGYQAELYMAGTKVKEADEILQRALTMDPLFPFGHWLRGAIRRAEGSSLGALLEFRKAVELYDPGAKTILARLHAEIFELEIGFNRYLAARAAIDRAIHLDPGAQELREASESIFNPLSRVPEQARKVYTFRPAPEARAAAWKSTLPTDTVGRLSQAIAGFEKLVDQDATDAAAWFNLGLARAWLGDHPKAIEALEKSIELNDDEKLNEEASAMAEVLKCAPGMEEGDYGEFHFLYRLQDIGKAFDLVNEWMRQERLLNPQVDKERAIFSAALLEPAPALRVDDAPQASRICAFLLIGGGMLRISGPSEELLDMAADEIEQRLRDQIGDSKSQRTHANFGTLAMEALVQPIQNVSLEEVLPVLKKHTRAFFEEIWINRPLHSLGGLTPIDAAASPTFRKRLGGLVAFMKESLMAASPRIPVDENRVVIPVVYDFDRLRRKLGLLEGTAGDTDVIEFDTLSVADLAAVPTEGVTDSHLEQAFRAAQRLDARDLAGKFARLAIERPLAAGQPERHSYFMHLIQLAQDESNTDEMLRLLASAEQADRETNEGKRRADYVLRQARIRLQRNETDQAIPLFDALIAESPEELKYYGTAAEGLLGKNSAKALTYAEAGLAKARTQNNRDEEQHFLELVEAAKR